MFLKKLDHKKVKYDPKLKHLSVGKKLRPNSRNLSQSFFYKYKNYDYFYDIWSNIHYGYVGLYSGFDEETLLNGSKYQQYFQNAKSFKFGSVNKI